MQAVAGLVTALTCGLAALIAVRLVRLGRRSKGPETWLGVYFGSGLLMGTVLSGALYTSWADPSLALPERWRAPLHALYLLCGNLGLFGIAVFTRRTFRPEAAWAQRLVLALGGAMVLSFAGTGWLEHFALRVLNGPAYWLGFVARVAGLVWLAIESFRYRGLLRRRLRLGLVEPLVANRFLLWGLWAVTAILLNASDPLARVWYWTITGTTEVFVPEAGRPIVVAMMAATSALGLAAAAMLFLTFFPTAGYRRWIAARHARAHLLEPTRAG